MNKIDIHNYEVYLLDFSEGNLTDELQMELELFLIQHPELEINLDELSLVALENENSTFSNKNSLKKSEEDLVSETQFIAYLENQLTQNERLELEKSCAINPVLLKELALYATVIAKPDTSIVFENKQSLKRNPKVIWFNFSATQYAAAACIIFLIGLFMLWPKTNTHSEYSTLANKTDVINTNTATLNGNKIIPSKTNSNELVAPEEANTSSIKHSSANKTQQTLLANNTVNQENSNSLIKDTLPQVIESPKNEPLIALNIAPVVKHQTVVQVITENDDEPIAITTEKKKKGIWSAASRAFKNLNYVGVKGVDGDEETNKDNTAYAITLGGMSITHKSGL